MNYTGRNSPIGGAGAPAGAGSGYHAYTTRSVSHRNSAMREREMHERAMHGYGSLYGHDHENVYESHAMHQHSMNQHKTSLIKSVYSDSIFLFMMKKMSIELDNVGTGVGAPITYCYCPSKNSGDVCDDVKRHAKKTIFNVVKEPQTNNIERVDDYERYIDEYDTCDFKLTVIDKLESIKDYDEVFNIENEPDDDAFICFSKKKVSVMINDYRAKYYALESATKFVCDGEICDFLQYATTTSPTIFSKYYKFFISEWNDKEKITYIYKNFFDYERGMAVIDMFTNVVRQMHFNNKHDGDVVVRRIALFKYCEIKKICDMYYYSVPHIMKYFDEKDKMYFGNQLGYTVRDICMRFDIVVKDNKTVSQLHQTELNKEFSDDSSDSSDSSDSDDSDDSDDSKNADCENAISSALVSCIGDIQNSTQTNIGIEIENSKDDQADQTNAEADGNSSTDADEFANSIFDDADDHDWFT